MKMGTSRICLQLGSRNSIRRISYDDSHFKYPPASRLWGIVMGTYYLASRFSRRTELRDYRRDLIAAGHESTARWLDQAAECSTPAAQRRAATRDLEDIRSADTLIAFGDEPRTTRSRSGHHVELGYALALGKRILLVEWRENVFHNLRTIEFYKNWPEALRALAAFEVAKAPFQRPEARPGIL